MTCICSLTGNFLKKQNISPMAGLLQQMWWNSLGTENWCLSRCLFDLLLLLLSLFPPFFDDDPSLVLVPCCFFCCCCCWLFIIANFLAFSASSASSFGILPDITLAKKLLFAGSLYALNSPSSFMLNPFCHIYIKCM